jgi:hypothetical protein
VSVIDKLEETEITLGVAVATGKAPKGTQVQFEFKAKDAAGKALTLPGDVAKPAAVDVVESKGLFKKGAKATITIKPPKVASLEPKTDWYLLSYTYKVGSDAAVAVADEYKIWPKKIKVTVTKKGSTDPVKQVELRLKGEKKSGRKTDDQGVVELDAPRYKVAEIEAGPGLRLVWKPDRDKGVEREAEEQALWVAKIVAPEKPAQQGKALQHYVNLEASGTAPKSAGAELEVEVGPKEQGVKTWAGDEVRVKCTYSKTGKSDTDPRPELLADGVEQYKASKDGKTFTGVVKVAADEGTAKFKLRLGQAGGETWEIKVGTSEATDDDTLELETWRRIYLQISRPSRMAVPDLSAFRACMQAVNIEVGLLAEKAMAADSNGLLWMDGEHCGRTKGTKYLLLGDTSSNEGLFSGLLDPTTDVQAGDRKVDPEKSPAKLAAQLLLCDEQVDFTDNEAFSYVLDDGEVTVTEGAVQRPKKDGSGDEAVQRITKLVIAPGAHFYARDKAGNSPLRKLDWSCAEGNGTFPANKIKVTYAGSRPSVEVDTSAQKAFQDAAAKCARADVTISALYEAAAVFNGESFGTPAKHMLVSGRFGDRPAAEICGTMAHELGHSLGMCISETYRGVQDADKARKAHGFHYVRSGNHCATGMSKSQYAKAKKKPDFDWADLDGTDLSQLCKCVIYGYGGPDRSTRYCDNCTPYFKAQDVTEFR